MTGATAKKTIFVFADWMELEKPLAMGCLFVVPSRGKEIFSFQYEPAWLNSGLETKLDPKLELFSGPQYPKNDHPNFGIFLDSSPDRWGRTLMTRREAQRARTSGRTEKRLMESDFLLGVFDGHRMGAIRFKLDLDGPFLDDDQFQSTPPWAQLRDLEYASLQLEKANAEDDKDYLKWLTQFFASAMRLLGRTDGDSAEDGTSYLEIVEFLTKHGSQVNVDLAQLWRRIVFNVCVSNVDDHLRNHGFILTEKGWKLSPAFDLNPSESGNGLRLNISATDNAQDLDLVLSVAENFRIKKDGAVKIMREVKSAVRGWRELAMKFVSKKEISQMASAFRIAEK
jgi:HipA-like C-terminal domain